MSMWQILAAGARGAAEGLDASRERQKEETEAAWQQNLRKRATALENFKMAQALAPGMIDTNPEAAAQMLNEQTAGLNAAGFDVPNTKIVGGKREEWLGMAPTGPIDPKANVVDVSPVKRVVSDFTGDQTKKALYGGFGVQPAAPKFEEVSAGASMFDPSTRTFVGTAPYAVDPNKMATNETREEIARLNVGSRERIAAQRIASAEQMLGRRLTAQERLLVTRLDYQTDAREDTQAHQSGMQDDRLDAAKAVREEKALDQEQDNWAQHRADFERLFPSITITSGKRDPFQNLAVGGVPNSYHLRGMAMDIVPPPPSERARIRAWATSRGMEIIDEGDHWHLEPRPGGRVPKAPKAPAAAQAAAVKRPSESQLLNQAEKQWGRPRPVDKTGGKDPSGLGKPVPDGLDDLSGVPLPQAIQAWIQGRDTIYQDLRKKNGYQ